MKQQVIASPGNAAYPGLIFLKDRVEADPEVGPTFHLGAQDDDGFAVTEVSIEMDETAADLLHKWLDGWLEEHRT